MSWKTDGKNPVYQEQRDLASRAHRVIRVREEFGLDPELALSHVVWPDHEGGPPSPDKIETAVRRFRRQRVAA